MKIVLFRVTYTHQHTGPDTNTRIHIGCTITHMLKPYAMLNSDRQMDSLFHSCARSLSLSHSRMLRTRVKSVCVLRRAYFPFVSLPFSLSCFALALSIQNTLSIADIYVDMQKSSSTTREKAMPFAVLLRYLTRCVF